MAPHEEKHHKGGNGDATDDVSLIPCKSVHVRSPAVRRAVRTVCREVDQKWINGARTRRDEAFPRARGRSSPQRWGCPSRRLESDNRGLPATLCSSRRRISV